MRTLLSRAEARRTALAAQGFGAPRQEAPSMRQLNRTLGRTGVLQVDSVNILQRAHYMPLYSRLGGYDTELLHRTQSGAQSEARSGAQSGRSQRRLVEYWAHCQALMPVELWPLMRHRMDYYRQRRGKWWREVPDALAARLLDEVRARGASTARDLDDGTPRASENWGWNWSQARQGLDYLYMIGELAVAGRNPQFEIRYDLPERVLPDQVLAMSVPTASEAIRELVSRAARSHGVATESCLRDYFRINTLAEVRPAIADLVEAGELLPVRIEGWGRPAYLHATATVPRAVHARALLSPFDPLIWQRERTERLFGFRYRIEIYTPAAQREFGYYVLPFLLGERLVGRVDLKADRGRGILRVLAAHAETDAPAGTATELAEELRRLGRWLGLDDVEVAPRGGLAAELAIAIG